MRKSVIMAMAALALAGCAVYTKGEPGKPGKPGKSGVMEKNFTILKQDATGGLDEASNYIIASQKDLVLMYKDLGLTEVPLVNFNEKTVIAVFMGQKNTGGYSIGIESVTIKDNAAEVQVKETHPDGMVTMALTNPYCIAVLPKTDFVKFLEPVKE